MYACDDDRAVAARRGRASPLRPLSSNDHRSATDRRSTPGDRRSTLAIIVRRSAIIIRLSPKVIGRSRMLITGFQTS
jgi:hypothetical protein